MLKTIFLTAVALVIAIGGGAMSVWYVLNLGIGIGAVAIGDWSAFPEVGTPDADPYSQARFAREGGLSLGRAEGIIFVAAHDASGALLRRNCLYSIDGAIPSARFWTLYATDLHGQAISPVGERAPALHSYQLLRDASGDFSVEVGGHPAPGNWLAIEGRGFMRLVLTLYDTPVATAARVNEIELPRIVRGGCDA